MPAGVQRLEATLSCGCCFCGQSEHTEGQAGVGTSKAIGKACACRRKSSLFLLGTCSVNQGSSSGQPNLSAPET